MHQEEQYNVCKILKLSSGETIIGNILKETVSYLDMNLPLKVLFIMHPDSGKMNLSILRWDPIMDYDQPVRVYKNSIVACAEPTPLMLKNYNDIMKQTSEETIEESEENASTKLDELMMELLSKMKGNGNTFH
jgi:hypothetical protein